MLKQKFTVEFTNEFSGIADPAWSNASTFRGTPRQIVEAYREFKRRSGGCDTSARTVATPITFAQIAEAVADRDHEIAMAGDPRR